MLEASVFGSHAVFIYSVERELGLESPCLLISPFLLFVDAGLRMARCGVDSTSSRRTGTSRSITRRGKAGWKLVELKRRVSAKTLPCKWMSPRFYKGKQSAPLDTKRRHRELNDPCEFEGCVRLSRALDEYRLTVGLGGIMGLPLAVIGSMVRWEVGMGG